MALTSYQKHYIKKNIKKLSIDKIADDLGIPEQQVEKFAKKHWPEEKYAKIYQKQKAENNPETFNFLEFFAGNINIFLLLFSLVLITYFNSLDNTFVSDDIANILKNPEIGKIGFVFSDFNAPLGRLIYFIIYHLFGLNPVFFRVSNILFHFGSTFLVFIILSRLSKKSVALFAAVIFAVHPILTESITWISGGPYARYAFFFLLSFFLYLISDKNKKLYYISIISFILSLFTYSMAAVLFLIYIAYEFSKENLARNWKKIIPYFCVSSVFVLLYISRIGGRISGVESANYQTIAMENPLVQIPIAISSYLKLIVWPGPLTLYQTELQLGSFMFFIRVLVFLAFLGSIFYFYKKNRTVFFWLSFFIITLLPTLTPFGISWIVAERYSYLGSVGIFTVIAIYLDKIIQRDVKYKNFVYAFVILAVIALSIRTIIRNNDWKNEDNLWSATVKVSPSGAPIHNNMGDVYSRHQNYPKAVEEFTKATQINPGYADAYHNLANIHQMMGNTEEAMKYYNKALSINPNIWQSWQNLSSIYFEKGDKEKSLEYIQKAIEINPRDEQLKKNYELVRSSN